MKNSAHQPRAIPSRSCVACRTVRPKRELVRVVRLPDGRVSLDEGGRLAGRGAYLCRQQSCWETALTKGALARALETPIPEEVRTALLTGITTITSEGGARGQE